MSGVEETVGLLLEITSLHGRMAEGKSKAEARREAKLEVMRNRPNPFYWAAFVLVGSPQ